ncbi:MAG: LapA family protein [Myxococcota bacterium]|nr:LapA family protein [Myxococcota bacterium]
MRQLRLLLLMVLLVGAAVGGARFSSENETLVSISYVFGTLSGIPIWLVLVSSFSLGVGLCLLALVGRLTRATLAQRRYRKTIAGLEAEVHQLRNLPIDGEPLPEAASSTQSVLVEEAANGADGAGRGV